MSGGRDARLPGNILLANSGLCNWVQYVEPQPGFAGSPGPIALYLERVSRVEQPGALPLRPMMRESWQGAASMGEVYTCAGTAIPPLATSKD